MARKSPTNAMHPNRPPLVSHMSNSVPSTPHQYAHEFGPRSRTPSPQNGLSNQSSRKSRSAINGRLTSLPHGRPTCKYESMAAFSRRRMQYDIGDALLEKPNQEPKKSLDPHEEKKLSGDMRELYDRLLPSQESEKRRKAFTVKLVEILRQEWPTYDFQVHVFGSSGNLLCTNESDVDVCIQTDNKQLESMHILAEALANNGMEKVVCVAAAKVPIVKVWDPVLKLAADVNVNNTLALENTRMIKTYVQLDERVRPLAMIIKHWTRQRILNDAGLGGTLSSYAWICFILNFLQTRQPPILPILHLQPHESYIATDGTESGFSDDVSRFKDFGRENKEEIGDLLFHFFRKYTYEFDYERDVISVRQGNLTRKEKNWSGASKEGQWRLCIEEPFNATRNLGNSADSTAFRGIHLEMRRAFDLLADGGQLDKLCEEYVFPPEEKVIFKKPPTGNRGITLQAPSSGPRQPRLHNNSGSLRNARNSVANGKGGNAAYRRSSMGPVPRQPANGYHGQYSLVTSPEMSHLWDPYIGNLNMLSPQSREQQQAFAQLAQQMQGGSHGHVAARAHAHTIVQSSGNSRSRDNSAAGSPSKTPYLNGSPRLEGQYTPNGVYDSPRTNPPSPQIAATAPRRTTARAPAANSMQGNRSQSQPARNMLNGMATGMSVGIGYDPMGNPCYYTFPTITPYQYTNELLHQQSMMTAFVPQNGHNRQHKDHLRYQASETTLAQLPPQPIWPNYSVAPIPPYGGSRRGSRVHDMQLPPASVSSQLSRSPSPLGHVRTSSTSLQAAQMLLSASQHSVQSEPVGIPSLYPRQTGGLLIIDGSGSNLGQPLTNGAAHADRVTRQRQHSDANTTVSEDSTLAQSFHSSMSLNQSVHDGHDVFHSPPYSAHDPIGPIFPDSATLTPINYAQSDLEVQPFPAFTPSSQHAPPIPRIEPETLKTPKSPTHALPTRTKLATDAGITPSVNGVAMKALDTRHLPLLSPVLETRTPSPTVHRRDDFTPRQSLETPGTVQQSSPLAKEIVKENPWRKGLPSSLKMPVAASAINTTSILRDPVPSTPAPLMEKALSAGSINPSHRPHNTNTNVNHKANNDNAPQSAKQQPSQNQWELAGKPRQKKRSDERGNGNSGKSHGSGGGGGERRSNGGGGGNGNGHGHKRRSTAGPPQQRAGNTGVEMEGRKGSVPETERKGG